MENSSGLFARYINDECTSDEIKMLLEHFDTGYDELLLKELIRRQLEAEQIAGAELADSLVPVLENTFSSIRQQTMLRNSVRPGTSLLRKIQLKRYAAAAAIIAVVIGAGWIWGMQQTGKPAAIIANAGNTANNIVPGGNKATLTLADGRTIVLDSAVQGNFAIQGDIRIVKTADGQLTYVRVSPVSSTMADNSQQFNTIRTPKGGQYQLVLPDGSKVWLNAATELNFSPSFNGQDRVVYLTGEAYFEIAKDPARPFIVKQGTIEVQVLGTSFNMNAYGNEDEIKTTLLEGSVRVVNNQSNVLLKPGQLASIFQYQRNNLKPVIHVESTDAEDAIAWKNGMFVFNNADIKTIMRQISRWYDVDVKFEGDMPNDKFIGEVSRNSNVSDVLKILELNNINFKINNKTITVVP